MLRLIEVSLSGCFLCCADLEDGFSVSVREIGVNVILSFERFREYFAKVVAPISEVGDMGLKYDG